MSVETFHDGRVVLHAGDCRDVLAGMAEASVDAIVTDPPYELGFMGRAWDKSGIAFDPATWAAALRVLKPGGHLVAFAAPKNAHRMVCAIEDAGFEIRDSLMWLFGSGFPKSRDVGKAIDALDAADERRRRALAFTAWLRSTGLTSRQINEATGTVMASHYLTEKEQPLVATRNHLEAIRPLIAAGVPEWIERLVDDREVESENLKRRPRLGAHEEPAQAARWRAAYDKAPVQDAGFITGPATDEAARWQGWGTALKPAYEPICLARKPLVGTVAANVMAHGAGALNIDACRVEAPGEAISTHGHGAEGGKGPVFGAYAGVAAHQKPGQALGRWPANVVHDGSDEVVAAFPDRDGCASQTPSKRKTNEICGGGWGVGRVNPMHQRGDSGSAARFFYSAKADAGDRLGSTHPTVKPVDLMQWLARMVTPPGGTILDPFAGTGTTGEAALREGFRAVLIEREATYRADIARRMAHVFDGEDGRKRAIVKARGQADYSAGPLFGHGEAAE